MKQGTMNILFFVLKTKLLKNGEAPVFHKCHTYQNAVTIFLLIREAETDHRVRKLYTFLAVANI